MNDSDWCPHGKYGDGGCNICSQPKEERVMKSIEAWNNLKEKFTSANRIPVERSNITREEYDAIKSDHALLEEAVNLIEDLDATINSVAGRKNDFLARAKERLG
jgi:hypothetical protein